MRKSYIFLTLGMAILLTTSLFVFAGCASTTGGPMSMAHEVHSMTPCGMMMEAMMGNSHGDHADDVAHGAELDEHADQGHMDSDVN